jgi:hypothetical protein
MVRLGLFCWVRFDRKAVDQLLAHLLRQHNLHLKQKITTLHEECHIGKAFSESFDAYKLNTFRILMESRRDCASKSANGFSVLKLFVVQL